MKYRAFISYSHADQAAAARLHRALEAYALPKALQGRIGKHGAVPARLAPVFRDREELTAAGSLAAEIRAALEGSLFLVVLCSPNAAKSHWVNEEIKLFKRLHGGERVLALVVAGEPGAAAKGRPEAECFPPALRFALDGAGDVSTVEAEPIAADARKEGDGWRDAFLKLVAGLAGVGLDDIVRREAQRRYRTMTAIAASAVALSAVMGLVTNYALDQRTAAVKARGQAEDLVGFMLTDLRKKLDGVGRLDVLQDVGKEALAYYKKQNARALDPDALGRRSRSLLLVGEVDNARGDLDAALAAYKEAAATTEEQLRRDPKNPKRMYDHAQSAFWVGYIAWQRGDRQTAERQMRDYLRLAEAMTAADPGNKDYLAENGYANSNLGTLLLEDRRWGEALKRFETARAGFKALADAAPDDASALKALGNVLSWVARAEAGSGGFLAARRTLAEELEIYGRLSAKDPKDRDVAVSTIIARNNLAAVYLAEGRTLAARSMYATAADAAEELLAVEKDNTAWIANAAAAHLGSARAYWLLGDAAAAEEPLSRASSLAVQLAARDPSIASWTVIKANALLLRGEMLAASHDYAGASRLVEETRASLSRTRPSAGSGDDIFALTLARAHLDDGDLKSAGDRAAAAQSWTAGLAVLGRDWTRLSPSERLTALALLRRLGRAREAQEIRKSLIGIGFRHPEFDTAGRAIANRKD